MRKMTSFIAKFVSDMRLMSTWFSTGTKLLGLAVILPLTIVKLTELELNFWLLGLVAINVINLIEFSITPSTVRQLSYQRGLPEEERAKSIATAAYTLHQVAAIFVAVLSLFTLYFQTQSIDESIHLSSLVWGIPVLLYMKLISAYYAAVLHTNDRIPFHRTVEAASNILVTALTIAILTITTDVALLLCLQIIPQAIILPIIRKVANRYQSPEKFQLSSLVKHKDDIVSPTLNQLSASLLGFGSLQIAAIYINATNPTKYANAFLLSLRLIQSTATFTNPFFYTFIPELARVIKSHGIDAFRTLARQKQQSAVVAFIVVTQSITIALFAAQFSSFGFEGKLPDLEMWIVLSVAFTCHRIGAINLQTSAIAGFVRFQTAEFVATIILAVQVALLAIFWKYQNIPVNLLITYMMVYLPSSIRIARQSESQSV